MNQDTKRNSVISHTRPSNVSNSKVTKARPKRCHNCQKMIVADKYEDHVDTCFRIKDDRQNNNNQSKSHSTAETPISLNKGSSLNTTQSRVVIQNQTKHRADSNMNKTRLLVSNNVIVPGKANSNITRKGPHKNIINSNLGQRKYKKNENPEEDKQKKVEKHEELHVVEDKSAQKRQIDVNQIQHNILEQNESQVNQQSQNTANRPQSRNIRTHSRPGSATRPTMQIRVAEESFRLANMYNSNTNRPALEQRANFIMRNSEINDHTIRTIHRMVQLSDQSSYQSEQLNDTRRESQFKSQGKPKQDQFGEQTKKAEKQRMERIRNEQILRLRERERLRQREEEIQRERRQRERQRQRQERQRQERQRQRERQRERERERERQREREIERERERERQRQRQRQAEGPRVNIDLLVQSTNEIINFVQALAINQDAVADMLMQLRQLNMISAQIQELNTYGRNLGFRMGMVFAQRIQELQNVILNQIGIVLLRNLSGNSEDFERLLSLRPSTQPILMNFGFNKTQIDSLFPLKDSTETGECSICLEDIRYRQKVRELQCKHVFHPDCIDGWMNESRKCPMCRHEQKSS